jgi:hypothetical protein
MNKLKKLAGPLAPSLPACHHSAQAAVADMYAEVHYIAACQRLANAPRSHVLQIQDRSLPPTSPTEATKSKQKPSFCLIRTVDQGAASPADSTQLAIARGTSYSSGRETLVEVGWLTICLTSLAAADQTASFVRIRQ